MKKLSAVLSLLLIVGLFYQGMALAEAKKNFTPKKKHAVAAAVTTPAPAPVAPAASPTT